MAEFLGGLKPETCRECLNGDGGYGSDDDAINKPWNERCLLAKKQNELDRIGWLNATEEEQKLMEWCEYSPVLDNGRLENCPMDHGVARGLYYAGLWLLKNQRGDE